MAVIFRKTSSLGKLLRINVGKNGLSASIGPKGSSISVGRQGVYANVSAPGTGLRVRQKLTGKTASQAVSETTNDIAETATNKRNIFWIIVGILGVLLIGALKK